jgi:hypothetical protein
MIDTLQKLLLRTKLFTAEAHTILGRHESSPSRVVLLEESYQKIAALSLKQDDMLRQALRCLENELFRAAHVMAWAGFMDFLEMKLATNDFRKLRAARAAWAFAGIEELRETVSEYQIIESARLTGLIQKNEMKALHGLLNKRNECAHPSDYYPGLNDTLGFVSEILTRIEMLRKKEY